VIVDKYGRSISQRTEAEEEESLRKELSGLSPDEREALMLMLAELADDEAGEDDTSLLTMISEAEYKHTPVDIETFVKDEYYLGNTCNMLYPVLLQDMKEMFEGGEYQEAILTGSIGWGKTFYASIGVCRILYELSCLHDPHRSLGLAPDTDISIVCLSVNENLAMKVAFDNVATKLKASPYFSENFPFKSTKKEFRFPHNVWLAARATTDTSALGLNVIGALLDETNFMDRGRAVDPRHGAIDHAEMLYTGIMRRMKSRFGRSGKLPGMIFLVSSKKTKDDFTGRRIRESRTDPHVFVRDYALWDVKPQEYYSSNRFHVICGNEQTPSRILQPGEEKNLKEDLPDDVVLIQVPEDFRFDFEHDLEGAIRDIAGVATVAISPFIQRREKLVYNSKRKHPFSVEVYDPSKPGTFLWDLMVRQTQIKDFSGHVHEALKPIVSPKAARHIHIDPAYRKDAVGICMGHIKDWKDVVRRAEDGEVFQERQPVFFVDLILQVIPPVGDEIVLGDLRRLVYSLSDHGYMITLVTMDTWQSVDSLQQLKQKGYAAEHLSVDTQMDPYENLKSVFYEDRIDIYNYPRLFKELRELEKDEKKKKVDHPPRGSKDIADALAGCLYTLAKHQATQPLPILSGLSYSPDAWMEEQLHAAAAHQHGSSGNQGDRFYPPNPLSGGGYPLQVLPPVLGGRGGGGNPGGGWNPSSL
jgi:hypothetical protein